MSSINEAYARIDYAYLKQLENEINDLKKQVASINNSEHSLRGTTVRTSDIRIFAGERTYPGNQTNFSINFKKDFAQEPLVFLTIEDSDARYKALALKSVTKSGMTFSVENIPNIKYTEKIKNSEFSVHFIVIGRV
jgi:hypothetical protein